MQGSARVKINEYVYAWSELLFVSLLLTFNFEFFSQINHFLLFYISTWIARCGKSLRSLERDRVEDW